MIAILQLLINSNIFIALAAVFLALETQVQIGLKPQWHPYLFLIFSATIFEYNFHRFITILLHRDALENPKHKWVKNNLIFFYAVVATSVIMFAISVFLAKLSVLITFAPIAGLTLLYSTPVFGKKKHFLRLRQIPYLKIFIIAFVWAATTVLIPIIHANKLFSHSHVVLLMTERFIFVLAITVPFDLRDVEVDRKAGLKTLPLFLAEKNSYRLSILLLFLFAVFITWHCVHFSQLVLLIPFSISVITTFIFLQSATIKKSQFYHYGVLDGTMLLQGVLVIATYYINYLYAFQSV